LAAGFAATVDVPSAFDVRTVLALGAGTSVGVGAAATADAIGTVITVRDSVFSTSAG